MAKGMGLGWGMGLRLALPLAMGTRHWFPQIGPGAVSADRDSVQPSLLPMEWIGLECQRVAAASIDSLIGCVVCPAPLPPLPRHGSGVTSTRRIRDSDDV